tara:strand:+ start:48 stop:716 length:669 start_codon:yes stop_codon:yes gene_type:complete
MSGIVGSKFNHRGSGLVGSLGTDGQHMLSSGAGKSNVFETVAAAGGDLVHLTTVSISDDATVAVDGEYSSTYEHYLIIISNVVTATGAVDFNMQINEGGSAVTSGYKWSETAYYHSGTGGNNTYHGAGSAGSTVALIRIGNNSDNNGTDTQSGELWIFDPLDTTRFKNVRFTGQNTQDNDTFFCRDVAGKLQSATASTGVTFYTSSGNLTSGSYALYGLKTS